MKDKCVVILPNYGAITTGDNIQVALSRLLLLEGIVLRNLAVAQAAQANAGHLSVAVDRERMLVNHFGPSFATMRPENVVLVDFSGRVLDGATLTSTTPYACTASSTARTRASARAWDAARKENVCS